MKKGNESKAALCAKCSRNCAQPRGTEIVSCARFRRMSRNLEMFDMSGNVSSDVAGPGGGKKGRGAARTRRKSRPPVE